MVFKNLANKIAPVARCISTSSTMNAGHGSTRGVFGSVPEASEVQKNLPFPVNNRYTLLGLFIVFFGSGLAIPFIGVRSMILSKNQS